MPKILIGKKIVQKLSMTGRRGLWQGVHVGDFNILQVGPKNVWQFFCFFKRTRFLVRKCDLVILKCFVLSMPDLSTVVPWGPNLGLKI